MLKAWLALSSRSLRRQWLGFLPEDVFGRRGDEDPELRRHQVQPLAFVLADPVQLALAAGAGLVIDVDDDLDPRQVRRQGSTIDAALAGSLSHPARLRRTLRPARRLADRAVSALRAPSPPGGQSEGAAVP
jgi:hypothetical protein